MEVDYPVHQMETGETDRKDDTRIFVDSRRRRAVHDVQILALTDESQVIRVGDGRHLDDRTSRFVGALSIKTEQVIELVRQSLIEMGVAFHAQLSNEIRNVARHVDITTDPNVTHKKRNKNCNTTCLGKVFGQKLFDEDIDFERSNSMILCQFPISSISPFLPKKRFTAESVVKFGRDKLDQSFL